MNVSDARSRFNPLQYLRNLRIDPGVLFVVILLSALFAFEVFNYSTTDFALRDLLGELRFAGIRWATILSLAFCGIDFAGIARLFTPEQAGDEPKEVWYLFGAWLLAATMNAMLTWWGVSMAIATHTVQSTLVMDPNTLTKVVPIFVAVMVWVIRILIIGTLSLAGDRLFGGQDKGGSVSRSRSVSKSPRRPISTTPIVARPSVRRPSPMEARSSARPNQTEVSYHNVGSSGVSFNEGGDSRSGTSRRI